MKLLSLNNYKSIPWTANYFTAKHYMNFNYEDYEIRLQTFLDEQALLDEE
ncbi:hypothetical protein H6G91_18375 [Nostoc muscorum FACHB-395]|nr:hypothetical protein [Desmonostoc muscorum FACHB-395]